MFLKLALANEFILGSGNPAKVVQWTEALQNERIQLEFYECMRALDANTRQKFLYSAGLTSFPTLGSLFVP